MNTKNVIWISSAVLAALIVTAMIHFTFADDGIAEPPIEQSVPEPTLDTTAYDLKLKQLAHVDPNAVPAIDPTTGLPIEAPPSLWPAEAVYPNYGALLPFHRIVAYYGNFYSKGMGVLGEYQPETMIEMLKGEVTKWEEADPSTPVVPAIDYIAVTAQWSAGDDGMYRARMPDSQIEKAISLAAQVNGIVILEVQAGLSDVLTEVKQLEPYLSLPQVHLAIDPEFATSHRGLPGRVVGSVDATEMNAVAEYLANLINDHSLPPKIMVIHRYTQPMVTHAADIAPLPEVQIVMDMDGWGPPKQKINTYNAFIYPEPVQFTGFKIFYHVDLRHAPSRLLTPEEILDLTPQPIFIQYQ